MESGLSPHEAYEEAVRIARGQSATARLTGISQSAVSQRLRNKMGCREKDALPLEAHTGVPRHLLRPDIYPLDLPPTDHHFSVGDGGPVVAFDRPALSKSGEA